MWEGQAPEEPSAQAHAQAQPSPTQGPGCSQPHLGQTAGTSYAGPSLILPGAAARRAHGTGEKTEGEREGDFRKEGERRYGVSGEDLEKGRNTRREHPTWHIPELKAAVEMTV